MTIDKPYFRTCRPFRSGLYQDGGDWRYIEHPSFAKDRSHYIRAFLVLQADYQKLAEFIEPSNVNLATYSLRLHELLIRICVEIEANARAILSENGFEKTGRWNISDYSKLERSHRLSKFEVTIPGWNGDASVRRPYSAWGEGEGLEWYQAYNSSKHDRHNSFHLANLKNVTDAICGLVAILSAQFHTRDFAPVDLIGWDNGRTDGIETAIGGFFQVNFPQDWPQEEQYDFDWEFLSSSSHPFQKFNFND